MSIGAGEPNQGSSGNELVIERVFDAPRELVWKAWTDPQMCARWWGPKGFTIPFYKADLRVGGDYLTCMRSPDGQDYWSKGVFIEIKEPERLVMTDSFADPEGNTVTAAYYGMDAEFPLQMLITVTLEEHNGKTMLTLTHSRVEDVKQEDLDDMRQGWLESFDKLDELLAHELERAKKAA